MPRNNMPPGWQPPAPAWQSIWDKGGDVLVAACFGVQGDDPAALFAWADEALGAGAGLRAVEQGRFADQAGVVNHLFIAYDTLPHFRHWWARHGAWWESAAREQEPAGYWREVITLPLDRFETLYSTPHARGVGVLAEDMEGPIAEHGYPGAARDRIGLSARDDLERCVDMATPLPCERSGGGRRVRVTPPEKMCVIRSGQDWSRCDAEEKTYYLEKVHPVLLEGMSYLRDNPVEASCYSLRFVNETGPDRLPLEQSFGLGYSPDIYAFENWAKSHPTHLAIFDSFMEMVGVFGEEMKLRLWHEVSVLSALECEFEYIGCHPATGLLAYAGEV